MPYRTSPIGSFRATFSKVPIKAPPLKGVRRLVKAYMENHVIMAETEVCHEPNGDVKAVELPDEWGIHPVCAIEANSFCFGR